MTLGEVLVIIDAASSVQKMSRREAIDFYRDIIDELDMRINALLEELARE